MYFIKIHKCFRYLRYFLKIEMKYLKYIYVKYYMYKYV